MGTLHEMTVLEIAWMIIEISDSESELNYEGLPEGDLKHRCALIRRTEEALGWEPRVGAREGLSKTIGWFARQLASRQEDSSPREEDRLCPRVARHGTKPRRSHFLKVSFSSVVRYVRKTLKGRSPSPGKASGKRPKMNELAGKLLEEDLKERLLCHPPRALRLHIGCKWNFGEQISIMCRAMVRIRSIQKGGHFATE
jgi:hypothetical protein